MYIRNYWIREGESALVSQINYKPWKVGIDDLRAVILTGYWYYLHKVDYHWADVLECAEEYYESCINEDSKN